MSKACPLALLCRSSIIYTSGNNILSIHRSSGEIASGTASSWVRCAALSPDESLLVVGTNCKQLQVYHIADSKLSQISSIEASKRITCITFSTDGAILFGDKSGKAFQWTTEQQSLAKQLHGTSETLTKEQKEQIAPTLMLGHCSLLTDIAYDGEKNRVLTSDQDGKIRVNSYPKFYNIEMFLLGHTEYVSSMLLSNNRVISGSGDGTARLWDLENASEMKCCSLPTQDEIKPSSQALLCHNSKYFFSRGNVLFVLSDELSIEQEISVENHILGACMMNENILLCSLLEAPYFVAFELSGNELRPTQSEQDLQLLEKMRNSLSDCTPEMKQEITAELFQLQKRRTENIKQLTACNKRRKLEEPSEAAVTTDGQEENEQKNP